MTTNILTGQDIDKIMFCPVLYKKFNINTTKNNEDFDLISKCLKYITAEYLVNKRIVLERDYLNICSKILKPIYKKHKLSKSNSLLISLLEYHGYYVDTILSKGLPVALSTTTQLQYNKTSYINECDMLVTEGYSLIPIYIVNSKNTNSKDINALLMCYSLEEHFKVQVKSYLKIYVDTNLFWNKAITYGKYVLHPGWQDRAEHYIKSLATTVENNLYYPNTGNCSICSFNGRCKL